MSKELNKATVEQAGGDERDLQAEGAQGERRITISEESCGTKVILSSGTFTVEEVNSAVQEQRAALAQPSPVRSSLLINGYQLRAALEFIAPDGTAKQLESEARIEWRQQDADFLEAGLYAWCAEYPEEGCVLLDEEPATAQPSQDAPYADGIADALERSDWTPKEALHWYAEGKHFDTVAGRTRVIDTGAVASNALKHLSLPYLEMKGDAELTELREAHAQPSPKCATCNDQGHVCLDWEAGAWEKCPDCAQTGERSPMAVMAEALRDKARKEQQEYQDRRAQAEVKLDFSRPLETENGEPVKWICADVIEYKSARVCVAKDTGLVYSSPYIGLKIRNVMPEQAEAERPEVVAVVRAQGFGRVCEADANTLYQHCSDGDELMTVAQHERIVGALRAERDGAIKLLGQSVWQKIEQFTKERDTALARVAELEKQEPVAWMHDQPNRVDVIHRDVKELLQRVPGSNRGIQRPLDVSEHYTIPLYAAPVAQAQQLHDLDKQCRDDVARALGLRPSQERGFAWSYLLASIKSCVKASEDAAQAQHSVSDDVERFLDEVRAELVRARSKFPGDRIITIALAEEFGELCKAVLDEPAANVRKEAVQTAVMAARVVLDGDGSVTAWRAERGLDPLAAAPGKEGL
ncbi:hypothetical protein ACSEQ4_20545 [Pseudomonas aeruginosa]